MGTRVLHAYRGVGGPSVNLSRPPRGEDHGVPRQRENLPGSQIVQNGAAANALFIKDGAQVFVPFHFCHQTVVLVFSDLLVHGVHQLLTRGGARESPRKSWPVKLAKETLINSGLIGL